ncbi:SDR family NAD(P)-dependent oxidoreductase [Nostoc sp. PCC 7107]|uniref:SDR family NAD(P)-dependent oxidoreductase n=1 Tax=Nostoc sp. PCC 7107 TaxID=317936 RepID=UPI0034618680
MEYALAQLFMSWGIQPQAMIGHSIGEYVAATIAGVFSLEDALMIVAKRGQLMQQLAPGSMLAIPLAESDVKLLLNADLEIAVINSPSACVVSGTKVAIAALQSQLSSQGIECRLLHTSHAFHSQMMQPIVGEFVEFVQQFSLHPPSISLISNVSGGWMEDAQATSPSYWGEHLRRGVRFSDGISLLIQQFEGVFLEVGPGRSLSGLTTQHLHRDAKQLVLGSLRHVKDQLSDVEFLLQTLGRLWLFGVEVDWSAFAVDEQRHRLPLPSYPFERLKYWIEPKKLEQSTSISLAKKPDIADWFYIPFWKPALPLIQPELPELVSIKACTLVFLDEYGLGMKLVKQLESQNQDTVTVKIGNKFTRSSEYEYTINPQTHHDYDELMQQLISNNNFPQKIVHLWNVTPIVEQELENLELEKAQVTGFYSLLFLAQSLGKQETVKAVQLTVISNNIQSVTGTEVLFPEKATLLGPVKVIPQEYTNINCRSIDVALPSSGSWQEQKLVENLVAELTVNDSEKLIAYRGLNRWVQTFEPVRLDKTQIAKPRLREKGVYVITGGLGGIGLVFARYLARTVQAKLLLIGRSVLPKKDEWEQWLTTHDETDSINRKIRQVQELENLGAEVLVVGADVSNIKQMQSAIAQAEQQFGEINGVIHAAGITEGKSFAAIAQISHSNCEEQFQPKVYGLLVLKKVLHNKQIDFCFLLSSLSSILGGLGHIAYSSANIFMDAFVQQYNQSHPSSWSSISWDGWQLDAAKEHPDSQELGINSAEGITAFQEILNISKFNHLVVSTGDIQARIKQWIQLESLQENPRQPINLSLYVRPELKNKYVAPRNEIEQQIAHIWQEILGIKDIGLYDNFFELGGDSLLIIQVRSKIIKIFNRNLSVAELFEYSTISNLAEYISGKKIEEPIFQQADERAIRKEAAMQEKRQLMKQRRKIDV